MKMEVWLVSECKKCGKDEVWENLTQDKLCEECKQKEEIQK